MCCSVVDVWLIIIDVNLVSLAIEVLVMHEYRWLKVVCVWMSCIWSLVCLLAWTSLEDG